MDIPPPIQPSLVPISEKIYQIKEKNFQLSNSNLDIGDYLSYLNIQPYEKINILIKSGIYKWEKSYSLPECAKLSLSGENYKNGGKDNTVTIFMTEKNSHYDVSYKKYYSGQTRLYIGNDSRVAINGINFIEKINDLRPLATNSGKIGIFNLGGQNSIFYFGQCSNELSSSPFINISSAAIGTVFINCHVYFNKNIESQQKEIYIVDTNTSMNSCGNKAIVITSSYNTHLGEGCYFKKKDNIEYHDRIEKYMK